ncbi:dTDP-glucose 4,6-dehydratase [Marmoricola endophyticus]|uniref:dTDP-glucose 4,6-dehydratase n=2 Tax=Marmoricola endophyticus TaxID=2040280 RepID=A0A917BGH2_9ACTN|nr:dTDP-glucose 4,6-dehydratase [Marmoricola endophyticus]
MAFDALSWLSGYVGLVALQRLIGDSRGTTIPMALAMGIGCAVLFLLAGATLRLHQGRTSIGSFEDVVLVTTTAAFTGIACLIVVLIARPSGNGVLLLAGPLLALTFMLWGRGIRRIMRDQRRVSRSGDVPTLVIGAGEAGRQLVLSMITDAHSPWKPVGFVDDDPAKRHRRYRGVAVLGSSEQLDRVLDRVDATTAVIAIPSASAEVVRRLAASTTAAGLETKILPSVDDLLHGSHAGVGDIRDLDVADLLGRRVIDTDVSSIAGYVRGKRVLVTGAGGSIGSELCRQLHEFAPAELIMLDRDESALHAVQLSITGRALLEGDDLVLGDIRDDAFVREMFARREPEVVFHAAALKHLPLLEKAPAEAIKTNVWGTLNVLRAAQEVGVERFVNISTDKAANPCSVLGYSKRLAEGLTAAVAAETAGTFLSVRFGNVLGSRGSVLTAFSAQIEAGGPVTVTDPEVTRYFMTIAEAVQLVIQAGAVGRDGEALVLDMGQPVSIDAVARQLIELADRPIEIVYTGLRPGEKMHEELFAVGESDQRGAHPLISHTAVPAYAPLLARELPSWGSAGELAAVLSRACLDLAHLPQQTGPTVGTRP